MSAKLLGLTFKSKNIEKLAVWYQKVLGMTIENQGSNGILCYFPGDDDGQASLRLIQDSYLPNEEEQQPQNSRKNVYWKIGLTLPDVDLARTKITNNGTNVSHPSQFRDIGMY